MKQASWVIFFVILFYGMPLQAKKPECSQEWSEEFLVRKTQAVFEQTLNTDHPGQRITLVDQGLGLSERCVTDFPQTAACLYYRALFLALQTRQNLLGYQKALVKIIKDLDGSIKLDPTYDQAGALRTKSYIYLKAPQFSLKKKSIVKDVDLAASLADQALKLYPNNRDNRLLVASVLFEQQSYEAALPVLKSLQKEYKELNSPNYQEKEDFKVVNALIDKIKKKKSKD